MKRVLVIIFLILVELAAVAVTVLLPYLAIISPYRMLMELRDHPAFFIVGRLLLGTVVVLVLSVMVIGVYWVIRRLTKVGLGYRARRMFFWQWSFLFFIWTIFLIVDITDILSHADAILREEGGEVGLSEIR